MMERLGDLLSGKKRPDPPADDTEALRAAGNAAMEAGDATGAIELYEKALAAAAADDVPAQRAALLNLSYAHAELNNLPEAEAAASQALEKGVCAKGLYRRAHARRRLKDFQGSYEDLSMALQIAPGEPDLRDEMRKLHAAAQRHEEEEAREARRAAAATLEKWLPADEVAAVVDACAKPFYAADATPGAGRSADLKAALGDAAVAALKAEGRLLAATDPKPCPGVNAPDATAKRNPHPSPCYVDCVCVGAKPYARGVAFRVVYGARGPPRVRQLTLGATTVLADDDDANSHHGRRCGLEFYGRLLEKAGGAGDAFSLPNVLAGLCAALEDDGTPRWAGLARQHARRRAVIDRYRHDFATHRLGVFTELDELEALTLAVAGAEPFSPLLPRSALAPALAAALETGDPAACCDKVCEGVYAFDLFSPSFVDALLGEIDAFYASKLPAARPNSMNNYGIIINDVGLEPFVAALQRSVLGPVAAALFGDEGRGDPATGFDSTHAFVVKYRADEDSHLDVHTDDSDVTFNVCLGRDFEGCGLVFCGMIGAADHRCHKHTYQHSVGRCVVHLGSRRHGADHITQGERLNLVVWNHGLAWRESPGATAHNRGYEKEGSAPDPRCVSYTHDRDYGTYKPYTEATEKFKSRGWCPPRGAEYDGFVADGSG